ncbi:MAG: helix-turn-helix domain-containing protein [Thauera sp.]
MTQTLRTLERGIKVLGMLDMAKGSSLRDIHARTGLPKPTLLRILETLEAGGLVWRSIYDGNWRRSAEWARALPQSTVYGRLAEVAAPHLAALQRIALWPSDLLVYRDFAMELAESARRLSGLAMNPRYHVGYRVDLFLSAPGRAWLAFCTDAEREAVFAHFADHPPTNPRSAAIFADDIESILRETRARGYAVRDAGFGGSEEPMTRFDDGLDAIAVPVPSATGVHAAINLVWPRRYELRAQIVAAHLHDLQATAADIARAFDATAPA